MSAALSNVDSGPMSKPPGLSKLLFLLGAISILTPFSLDMYLPALPSIARDLWANASAVELTLPSFFAGLALSQLLFGSLADHLGRRPPLLCGLALSVIGSVGCALSAGVASLTVWRVVQALKVGSASVIPRAVVRDRLGAVRHAPVRVRRLGRGGGERAPRWNPPRHGGRHVRRGHGAVLLYRWVR